MAGPAIDGVAHALLKKYDADGLEKWQTEQGYFACVYGSYQPRLQGRWTMLEMMLFEQYGLPKEHNHLWYDRSHGFWDFPTWWENDDNSFNPAAPLMRIGRRSYSVPTSRPGTTSALKATSCISAACLPVPTSKSQPS